MLTSGINFINFKLKSSNLKIKKELFSILNNKNEVLLSLGQNYKINFNLNKYKNFKNIRVIAMGGSTLGTQTIYDFLKHILQQINSAFGYTMKLMPYINEMQEIVIFNQNPALILEPSKLPTFDLAGYRLNKPNNETGLSFKTASLSRPHPRI